MAALHCNGTELVRIERVHTVSDEYGDDTYRTVYSVRSNRHVLKKRMYREKNGRWYPATFKRYRKLKAADADNTLSERANRWADNMCENKGFSRTTGRT